MSSRHGLKIAMLGAALLTALPAGAHQARQADAVYYHGKIITLDKRSTIASGVAIQDGRFIAVGDDKLVRSFIGPRTEVVDLHGRTVIPGLNDTHAHIEHAGMEGFIVPLQQARSVPDALERIRAFVATRKPGEWIVSSAWHPLSQLAEHRYLTRRELDSVAPNNPVVLQTVGHTLMVNSAALRLAGIDRNTADPVGGRIERDADGEPNGILEERAIDRMLALVPRYTPEQLELQFARAFRYANSYGITSILAPALLPDQIRALQGLMLAKRMTLRVGAMWLPDLTQPVDRLKAQLEGNGTSSWFGNEWLKLVGIKMIADGGMTLRTAMTRSAYPDDHSYHGLAAMTHDQLVNMVGLANARDWRVGVHCVGDAACDWVLDAYEAANKQRSILGRRFAIIHGSLIRPEQLRRAKSLGARVEMQNVFMWDKAATVAKFLGPETADRAMPVRSAVDILGIDNVSLGTDFPANTLNPFTNLYVAVTRKDPKGKTYGASQAVTREEALRMYTVSGAFATNDETIKGSIEVGKLADFAVLSDDYLTVGAETIKDISVLRTVVDGRTVFTQSARKAGETK